MLTTTKKTRLKNVIDKFLTQLQTKQDAYYATHNRYWQGVVNPVITSTDAPSEEALSTPNNSRKASDVESWTGFGIRLPQLPFSVSVDVYQNQIGWGYSCTFTIKQDAEIYRKTRNFGNEDREVDWSLQDTRII